MSTAPQSPEPRPGFSAGEAERGSQKSLVARYRGWLIVVAVALAVAGALIHKSALVIFGIILAAVALNGCG